MVIMPESMRYWYHFNSAFYFGAQKSQLKVPTNQTDIVDCTDGEPIDVSANLEEH